MAHQRTLNLVLVLMIVVMFIVGFYVQSNSYLHSTGGIDDATFTVEGIVVENHSSDSEINIAVRVTACDLPYFTEKNASFVIRRSSNRLQDVPVGQTIAVGDEVHIRSHHLNKNESALNTTRTHAARCIATQTEWNSLEHN